MPQKTVHWFWIAGLLLCIKFFYYYQAMEIQAGFVPAWLISVLLCLFFVSAVEKARIRPWLALGFYALIGIMVIVDVVYYRYFYQLFTFNLMGQVQQISSVSGTVKMLLYPADLILLFDVPFMVIHARRLSPYKMTSMAFLRGLVYTAPIVMVVALVVYNPMGDPWINGLRNQEFVSYHAKDALRVLLSVSDIQADAEHYSLDELLNDQRSERQDLFGVAKGRNVYLIQVESLQQMVIEAEYGGVPITPHLNALINKDSLYFENFYQQLGRGNTSDAEFCTLNSILPPTHGQAYSLYQNNTFIGLPRILKDEGYGTAAFHGFEPTFWNRESAYPGQGIDRFYSQEDFVSDVPIGFGLNDMEFFDQSIELLKDQAQPNFNFMITLTSHSPYTLPQAYKKLPQQGGGLMEDYFQSLRFTDEALGIWLDDLKASGLYEDSVIVIYGDHFGINQRDHETAEVLEDWLGKPYDYDEMLNVPLIIHIPGSALKMRPDIVGGHVDIMPTLLNLLGLPGDQYFFMGRDLVNSASGFVISKTYLVQGSYIDDHRVFEMSRDGLYESSRAWSLADHRALDIEASRSKSQEALDKIQQANYILEQDLVDDLVHRLRAAE